MNITLLLFALGGIGLLLLGMYLITEGLKNAAGSGLSHFLEKTTQTRFRAAATGFGITAIVQSSGAVIVTTLGFTNAGILSLRQAAWVVFGSNLGTTLKAWLVAFIGLNLNIEAFALPLIGFGMFLKLIFQQKKAAHLGFALAGFGVLFLGLGVMRDAFGDVAAWLPIEQLHAAGFWGVFLALIAGVVLTALMQSSSASMAIIITASVTGIFTPLVGAALVIGANLGTTTTSILAAIGATTNAKRLAAIHVTEKIFTGTIALLMLVPMLWVNGLLFNVPEPMNISMGLALFHTLFNVLSLILMSFLAGPLIRFVERRIRQPELTSEATRYIDDTVLEVPVMGVSAMHSELKRVFKQLLFRGRKIITADATPENEEAYINTQVLLDKIEDFAAKLGKNALTGVSEPYINLGMVRQELVSLRIYIQDLHNFGHDTLQKSMTQSAEAAALPFFLIGTLKEWSTQERSDALQTYQDFRCQQRAYLLEQVKLGAESAHLVTRCLQVYSLLEEIIKLIINIAEIIYPVHIKEPYSTNTVRALELGL